MKGFLQGTGRLRRIQKRFSDLPLVLDGESDNLRLFDGAASGFTRRRHDKIREGAPFDFRSTLQQRVNIVRKTRFKSGCRLCLFGHIVMIRQTAVRVKPK